MKDYIVKLLRRLAAPLMIAATFFFYDTNKTLLDYMEYLPVYRVERLWEREAESTFWFGDQFRVKTQQ